MKTHKFIFISTMAAVFLSSCTLTESITYNNPYAGDWYELEESGSQWNAVKLSMSDTTFEISTSTFNADGENPGGYTGVSKGDIKELSSTQIYMSVTRRQIDGDWYTREEYVSDLVDNYAFTQSQAELQADIIFIGVSVSYTIGSNPARLILGSGTGTGSNYTEMTYYTSVFSAKDLAH